MPSAKLRTVERSAKTAPTFARCSEAPSPNPRNRNEVGRNTSPCSTWAEAVFIPKVTVFQHDLDHVCSRKGGDLELCNHEKRRRRQALPILMLGGAGSGLPHYAGCS